MSASDKNISHATHSLVENRSTDLFFENLPALLGVEATASLLNLSVATIYDWRYRGKQKRVPPDLFLTFNRKLFVKTEVLKRWIVSQNSP
jgi:hypothetical protein